MSGSGWVQKDLHAAGPGVYQHLQISGPGAGRAVRQEEVRSEDLQKFTQLIENCVQTKVDTALNPVIERHNDMEEKTAQAISELTEKLEAVQHLVTKIVPESASHSTASPPPRAPPGRPWPLPPPSMPPVQRTCPPTNDNSAESIIKHIFEAGRLTLGVEPINQDDLNRVARMNNIQDSECVMKLAVAEFFFRYYMNVDTPY